VQGSVTFFSKSNFRAVAIAVAAVAAVADPVAASSLAMYTIFAMADIWEPPK
jgi:hypothetical protein